MELFKHSDSEFTQVIEGQRYECIRICTANRLLTERGTVVSRETVGYWLESGRWPERSALTHTALLINIELIKRESADEILARLVRAPNIFIQTFGVSEYECVKAVLERK